MGPQEFADIALRFMIGLASGHSAGFSMMDPEVLKKQRWTVVKYLLRRMDELQAAIIKAAEKK